MSQLDGVIFSLTFSRLSIGAPCASLDLLGRYKCWSLKDKSPAHLVWKAVSKAITSLLDDQFEHLDAGGSDLMIEMFMVGRRMNSCSPTILFSCESKACRHKAMELVKKKAILASHPGVLMAESSRLPRLLALGEDSEILNLPPGVYGNGPFKSCGMPILISGSHGGALRKATLGGIICIDEDYYGVTTAHAFVETKQEGIREDGDIEFAFYGLGEPDDSTDDEDNSVEMTSQGKT
jgi:hypothetical protein